MGPSGGAAALRAPAGAGAAAPRPPGPAGVPPVEWLAGPVDVFHATNYVAPPARRAAGVVTVHDLQLPALPGDGTAASARYLELVPRALGRGAVVCTPTAAIAAEVADTYRLAPERLVVTPLGIGSAWPAARRRPRPGLAGRPRPARAISPVRGHPRAPQEPAHPARRLPGAAGRPGAAGGRARRRRRRGAAAGAWPGRRAGGGARPGRAARRGRAHARLPGRGRPGQAGRGGGRSRLPLPGTRGSGCRPWRRWPAASRSSPPTCRRCARSSPTRPSWCRPGDADALADALLRVLGDPGGEPARAARRARSAGFTWDACAQATLAAYSRALGTAS